ncbi:MAG: hypothetical protein HYY32_00685 [Chloroflexi bacterium]|nr:hypothetical protein [Chloroflexota bacterium]
METEEKKEPRVQAPGTLVLVLVFMAFFLLMIVVNFVLLSQAWPVR